MATGGEAGGEALPPETGSAGGILRALRSATAEDHERVEQALDLMAPDLTRERLADVLSLLHGFWTAAEAGLDGWAAEHPADAAGVEWPRRRRAALFAADLAALGGRAPARAPGLPELAGTDDALGRLYVLEGSTLGGTFIDRHLAGLPALRGVRIHAFSPYGTQTGAMWHAFRRVVGARVEGGGDAGRVVEGARSTFAALAAECQPARSGSRRVPA